MNFIKIALNVIEIESAAISGLANHLGQEFQKCCELILQCQGKVIITGIGKSGLIGKKISATLSSTGTPSLFLHPTEALHGDFGMLQPQDIVIAISHSGSTDEICKLIPSIKSRGIPLISISGQAHSPLENAADIKLNYGPVKEACPIGLAPTTSTTLTLVIGDALASALIEGRQFKEQDFAVNHPGGNLGKKFITAQELSHQQEKMPIVFEDTGLLDSLIEISSKKLGMCCVINHNHQLVGILTDGDIRRHLLKTPHIHQVTVSEVMNKNPKSISPTMLAIDALKEMKNSSITSLVIVNQNQEPLGILHVHDLLKAGLSN